jgi:uncharacterized membrane protein YgcG
MWWPGAATAQIGGERIESFQAGIQVQKNSTIEVTERIVYYIEPARPKHGIFRVLPYKYKARGGDFTLAYDGISVRNKADQAVPFTVSQAGKYKRIQIGDPDVLVSGEQEYILKYRVERAVNYFTDHDELYWNVTGNEWSVPIISSSAKVSVTGAPQGLTAKCYTGILGSTEENCVATINSNPALGVEFVSKAGLSPKQGLTIVVGFPKGVVSEPTQAQKLIGRIQDNGILVLPVLVLGFLYWLWRKYGKDPVVGTIVPEYEPPAGFSPAELQVLRKGRIDFSALGPQLVYLANLGAIKISREKIDLPLAPDKDDYVLYRVEAGQASLSPEDQNLLEVLFEGKERAVLLEIKRNRILLAKILTALKKYEKTTIAANLYQNKSRGLAGVVGGLGGLLVVVGMYLGFAFNNLFLGLALVLSGIIAIIFGVIMPARTLEGAKLYAKLLGFAEYIKVAEQDRIAFHDAPEKSPERFQKFLPFAMLLGLEKAWTKIFDGFVLKPDWYEDRTGMAFSALAFSDSMGSLATSTQNFSTAASGGSGFSGGASGGGGGGGGGGSW